GVIVERSNPFAEAKKKPSHLNSQEVKAQIANTESEVEKRNFAVALEKKYTTPFLPVIIALFTAPFALSLSRKGKAATIGYAVGLWLLFMGINSTFEQLGLSGSLPATAAVWAPLALFCLLGIFLLSRVRT
ncbi:MAG: LptF/LptG family permease, partial [Acidobacteriota bacterium]